MAHHVERERITKMPANTSAQTRGSTMQPEMLRLVHEAEERPLQPRRSKQEETVAIAPYVGTSCSQDTR